MSSFEYYKSLGYSPVAPKHRIISNATVADTITLWTPLSANMRIVLTNLAIASPVNGTIAFYFGGDNDGQKIAEFKAGTTVMIFPVISSWESTAKNAPLLVRVNTGATDAWSITAEGFEVD